MMPTNAPGSRLVMEFAQGVSRATVEKELAEQIASGERILTKLPGPFGAVLDSIEADVKNWHEMNLAYLHRWFRTDYEANHYIVAAPIPVKPSRTAPTLSATLMYPSAFSENLVKRVQWLKGLKDRLKVYEPTRDVGDFSLSVGRLHPRIKRACESRLAAGFTGDAVHRAAIALEEMVRKKSGLFLDGPDLMAQAFRWDSEKGPSEPLIQVVADLTSKTGRSVQLGTQLLAQGIMYAFRNPNAHQTKELSPTETMETLGTISRIARLVDAAPSPTAQL